MALRTRTRLAALAGALLLAGCAYGPPADLMVTKTDDTSFGYSDRQVGPSQYEVIYVGPEAMTREIVPQRVERVESVARDTTHDLALWRAAQVARQKGASEFVVTHTKSETDFYIVGRDYRDAPSVYQGVKPVNPLYVSAIYFRPKVTLSVDLDPAAKGDRHDTGQVADAMGRKYAEGIASAGVPQSYFYFGPSAFIQKYRAKIEAEARAGEARRLGGPESYISTGPPYYRPYNAWK